MAESRFSTPLMVVTHVECRRNLWNSLRNISKSPFVAQCRPDFIMDQYGRNSELPHNVLWRSSIYRISAKSAKWFMECVGMPYGLRKSRVCYGSAWRYNFG
jgi:hypothetical protein